MTSQATCPWSKPTLLIWGNFFRRRPKQWNSTKAAGSMSQIERESIGESRLVSLKWRVSIDSIESKTGQDNPIKNRLFLVRKLYDILPQVMRYVPAASCLSWDASIVPENQLAFFVGTLWMLLISAVDSLIPSSQSPPFRTLPSSRGSVCQRSLSILEMPRKLDFVEGQS